MSDPHISITGVEKRFSPQSAVGPVDLVIGRGEILALLGPSGCGKTTLLRCIAGLEQPTAGEIEIGGRLAFSALQGVDESPEKRQVGLVFQSYALWPHMTVGENVAYGLRLRKVPAPQRKERVASILSSMGLSSMADRFPATLSGGQQQRVAIARSLVVEASVILFDEPLSNLDVKLREEMRFELRHLIKRTNVTAIFVTHDQSEAMVLADRICLMHNGKVEQIGTPRDLYHHPVSRFAMDFFGSSNVLPVAGVNGGRVTLSNGRTLLAETCPQRDLAIRPEMLEFVPVEHEGANVLAGQITESTFLGGSTLYDVDIGEIVLRVSSPDASRTVGDRVGVHLPAKHLLQVDRWSDPNARDRH